MSTDYDVVCDVCKLTMHAGQRMAMRQSFGYGPNDTAGAQRLADFIGIHIWCDLPRGVRIVIGNQTEDPGTRGYHHVNDDDPADVARALEEKEDT